MKLLASLALFGTVLAAQTAQSNPPARNTVTAIRHWSLGEVTRIAVEVAQEFQFRSDRLHNPERVYYDILESRPDIAGRRTLAETIGDKLVSKVRVAENAHGITRIVLDLANTVEISTSQLTNPNRLMIELRLAAPGTAPTSAASKTVVTAATTLATPPPVGPMPLAKSEPALFSNPVPPAPEPGTAEPSKSQLAKVAPPEKMPALEKPAVETARNTPILPAETSKAAKPTATGSTSLVRALGLKVGRIVIDPGHGGHDQGTQGPKGLLEKDLVLDVSLRLGKLVESKLGAEVIYTRDDDTFIPLEDRPAFANDKKADLFLSIHANSSPINRIAGVETYYLNFTDVKESLAVASRENASAGKSVFELQDIVKRITLHEKAEESRDFAGRIQAALYKFSSTSFPASKNRGVRKAPFIVLIGARIPSVLAEIGFLSNPREEALLKKPEYRQKLAEALFRGLQSYAETLSHFQVAQAKD